MSFSAVIVAAGGGTRAGPGLAKQWRLLAGKPVLRWSVEALLNAGAREMSVRQVGFGGLGEGQDASKAKTALEKIFSPEFRNRLDAVVLFSGLDRSTILKVVDKEVGLLRAQLAERNVRVEISDAAREWLADAGYDPKFGARPMARTVETHLKKPIADAILFGPLAKGGGTVRFEVVEKDGVKTIAPDYVAGESVASA